MQLVVSTVGQLKPHYGPGRYESLGSGRYYETMAFHAVQDGQYVEADTGREVRFEAPGALDAPGQDNAADQMHEAAVLELQSRLEHGEFFG